MQDPNCARSGRRATVALSSTVLAVLVGGCTTYWAPGPNAQGTFAQASARCRLLSRGMHQDPEYVPSSNRALSNTAYGLSVLGSLAQDETNKRDCMEALGWEQVSNRAPSTPAPVPIAAPVALTAPPPAPVAAVAPAAVASPSPIPAAGVPTAATAPEYPPSPTPTAVSSPAMAGQTVLFPVTINNPYQAHWTVGGPQ